MSYQPYPSGGSYQPYPASGGPMGQPSAQPVSVRNAVWLMYGGAALSAISAVLVLILSSTIKNAVGNALRSANTTAVRQHKTPLTATQIHSVENLTVGIFAFVLLVGVALWIWMAWANGKGRSWARIVASVLFAFNTIYLVLSVSRAGLSVIFVALGWLLGLGAIILLWRKESTAYFQAGRRI